MDHQTRSRHRHPHSPYPFAHRWHCHARRHHHRPTWCGLRLALGEGRIRRQSPKHHAPTSVCSFARLRLACPAPFPQRADSQPSRAGRADRGHLSHRDHSLHPHHPCAVCRGLLAFAHYGPSFSSHRRAGFAFFCFVQQTLCASGAPFKSRHPRCRKPCAVGHSRKSSAHSGGQNA